MALVSHHDQTILLKIVYLGAKDSGKTRSIQTFKNQQSETKQEGYFDFLPLKLKAFDNVTIHLFSLPSHDDLPYLNTCLLANADGYICHVDPRKEMFHRVLLEKERLQTMERGLKISLSPMVLQINYASSLRPNPPLDSLKNLFEEVPWTLGESDSFDHVEKSLKLLLSHDSMSGLIKKGSLDFDSRWVQ